MQVFELFLRMEEDYCLHRGVNLCLCINHYIFCVICRPDQPLDIIQNYMMDKLSGENAPRLHLVSVDASQDIQASLSSLAAECQGHFHSYCSRSPATDGGEPSPVIEDSDIVRVREEIAKAQEVLCNLKSVEHGDLGTEIMDVLREV